VLKLLQAREERIVLFEQRGICSIETMRSEELGEHVEKPF
jgi:hypothetical protein